MKMRPAALVFSLLAIAGVFSPSAWAQTLPYAPAPAQPDASTTAEKNAAIIPPNVGQDYYTRPSQRTRVNNFVFDAFGPYPIGGAALAAGINQFTNSPPAWNQGVEGYSKRFGSNLGIVAVATSTRYGLSEALKEDTLYYRCDCTGIFPRVRHALLSTLTARQGNDGHRVFSLPALIAPYAGTMTAVYAWYPGRYGAKDAFRMGNYSLLAYAGGNVSLEFFYSGPHSLLSRMHLTNPHAAPDPGPNHAPDAPSSSSPNSGPTH